MKILITGSTGYFGREFIREYPKDTENKLIAATSNIEKANSLFQGISNLEVVSNDDLINKQKENILDDSCIIIHAAFCRQSIGYNLVQSLEFSRRLFQAAVDAKVRGIVNLSSQSVYGGIKESTGNEQAQLNPGYLYALAKCGSEELLNQAVYFSKGVTMGCNIRLASLIGATDTVPDNVLYKFICSALEGKTISIVGGTQKFSFLDIHDAVRAILLLSGSDPSKWEPIFNLGPEAQTGITEMAELVINKVENYTGNKTELSFSPDEDHNLNSGMDSSKLYKFLNWKPSHSFEDIVNDTIQFVMNQN